ncbi:MAG: hypothetical protein IJT94_06100 [Oscillibacter sp.]|nr:hypothetical protein [Oscillibacter sp.]
MEKNLEAHLNQGRTLQITIKRGSLGCSDAQDACDEHGFLLLYKRGDNYLIDTPDGENIVFVDSLEYVQMIVAAWGLGGIQL